MVPSCGRSSLTIKCSAESSDCSGSRSLECSLRVQVTGGDQFERRITRLGVTNVGVVVMRRRFFCGASTGI